MTDNACIMYNLPKYCSTIFEIVKIKVNIGLLFIYYYFNRKWKQDDYIKY